MDPIALSLFDLFKTGPGPSSSHTFGPMSAGRDFVRLCRGLSEPQKARADAFRITLYGALSATGKGHLTDRAVVAGLMGFAPHECPPGLLMELGDSRAHPVDIGEAPLSVSTDDVAFGPVDRELAHPNTLTLALAAGREVLAERTYRSVGGGFLDYDGRTGPDRGEVRHPFHDADSFLRLVREQGLGLEEVMLENERALTGAAPEATLDRLDAILAAMLASVSRGLDAQGELPGPLHVQRKAPELAARAEATPGGEGRLFHLLSACAFAAAEENAAGSVVVTAPTCGSAGVVPSVARMMLDVFGLPRERVARSLLAAALVGFVCKQGASISGAEVGCQGEIGVASAMAAAMLAQARGLSPKLVENAAEIALEHHLGLTCDPVGGFVQIPCIERNAMGAVKAVNACLIAEAVSPDHHRVSLDTAVRAMAQTGRDMCARYKETSLGGLAVCLVNC